MPIESFYIHKFQVSYEQSHIHMDRAEQIPRTPESNGEERWSSMDGTLIAIGAAGALPKSAVGRAAESSPIWIGSTARRGRKSRTNRARG